MKKSSRSFRSFSLTKCLALGVGLTTANFSVQNALAQSTWTGTTSQDYNDGTNWSNGFPNGTNALVNTATGNYPIISATPTSGTPVDIYVGVGGNASGRLDQTAGSAGTGSGNWFFLGSQGTAGTTSGTFNLANTGTTGGTTTGFGQGSGSFTAGRVHIGGGQYNGDGTGTLNMNTSGTLTATGGNNGGVNVGVGIGFAASDVGTMNLDNGTVNSQAETWVGGAGTGTLNQAGGTFNSTGYLVVGRTGGTGLVNLSAGTLNGATSFGLTTIGSGAGSTGTVNVSGTGALNSNAGGMIVGEGWTGTGTATGSLNLSGNGSVNLGTNGLQLAFSNGNGAVGNGTLNLNGGILKAGSIFSGGGISTVNFNGGTLQATQASTTFVTGLTTANVQVGGAKIDTNGFDVTVGQSLLGGTGDGGLTKNGAGTLLLAGTNTFTGPTTVAVGVLTLTALAELSDTATLSLSSGTTLNLNAATGTEVVNMLVLNGTIEPAGTYTATQLNAFGAGVTFSSATGETLTVAVPEPATYLGGALLMGVLGWSQRRRFQARP